MNAHRRLAALFDSIPGLTRSGTQIIRKAQVAALGLLLAQGISTTVVGQVAGTTLSHLILGASTASPIKAPTVGPDGRLYVAGHDGFVRGIDPENFNTVWKTEVDTHAFSPVCGPDGRLYVGGYNAQQDTGSMTVLDASTGAVIRRIFHTQTLGSSGLITPAGHLAYVAGRRFHLVDTATFRVLWTYDLESACGAPIVNAHGVVYLPHTTGSGFGERLVALDTVNRRELPGFLAYTSSRLRGKMAAAADGTLYLPCQDGNLYAIDGATGDNKWEHDAGGLPSGVAIDAAGRIYYGSQANRVFCLDPKTGQEIWSQTTRWNVESVPCIGEGGLVYVTAGRFLYALDSKAGGTPAWISDRVVGSTLNTGSPILTTKGRIHYGTQDNAMVTVHTGDRPSRTAQWGVEGGDLAHSWRVQLPGSARKIWSGLTALGRPTVMVSGFAGDRFELEYSSDLKSWRPLSAFVTQNGFHSVDPLSAGLPASGCVFRIK